MLHADWGDYYVKPYYNDYLNDIISSEGTFNFTIRITTGFGDANIEEVIFYLVKRTDFLGIKGEGLNTRKMAGKYLAKTTFIRERR